MNRLKTLQSRAVGVLFLLGSCLGLLGEDLPESITEFFDANCYDCHNADDAEGELDLESLAFRSTDRDDLKRWSHIYDRVRKREMPPRGEPDGREAFLREFEGILHRASRQHQESKGRVRSRRLSRIEFENTLHDLLGIDLPVRQLLPEDASQDGFGNVADAQQVSYHLLEKYLEIIDLALNEAFQRATQPPPTYRRELNAKELSNRFKLVVPGGGKPLTGRQPIYHDGYAIAMACQNNYHGRMLATTVPETGWYRFTLRAKAFNPPPGRGVWTKIRSGVCYAFAPQMFWVGQFLAEEQVKEFVFETWMIEGHRLELRPGDHTLKFSPGPSVNRGDAVKNGGIGTAVESIVVERIYRGPGADDVRARLFGGLSIATGRLASADPERDLRRLLLEFAGRAFRRPVSTTVLEPFLEYAHGVLKETESIEKALYAGYRSLLSSPRFLFFMENLGGLDDHALASRLSYFLWSSQPDDELLQLADQGSLADADTLATQVNRLLSDPRSDAFIRNFSDDWLSLKEIDFTSPDGRLYPEFDAILKHSMVAETRAFLREMIDSDLSVSHVIDSDFVMVNERLAKHYGLAGLFGGQVEKVALKGDEHRGGLLTQGSVLKVTANGTTTSPIVRGVWLLERILGEHVPPPPDDVPAVEPDIRGAVSIRDQLEKHRSTKSCMACHQKIDPPGFALENYDVIGGWRRNYRSVRGDKGRWKKGPVVDASYELKNGQAFDDIEGFKAIALEHPEKIARNLLEKLLIYATGASIEFADRREIDRIVEQSGEGGYGLRDLIHQAVQSKIFRSK